MNRSRSRIPATVTAVITVGAASAASVGVGATPGAAEPGYPSWNDVQNAKNNEAAKKTQVDAIVQHIGGLQSEADEAAIHSAKKAESFRQARNAADEAKKNEDSLRQRADAAAAKTKVSRMRAGLLTAHLTKRGGANLSISLLLGKKDPKSLLNQLGQTVKLTTNFKNIYAEAATDENVSSSLLDQSGRAKVEWEKCAKAAETALDDARGAALEAQDLVAKQNEKLPVLVAQLAELKNSTIDAEMTFLAGQAATSQVAVATTRGEASPSPSTGGVTYAGAPSGSSAPSRTEQGGRSGGEAPRSTVFETAPPASPVSAPDRSARETAINFARAQVGKPYQLGGSGPDVWDCSGLTKGSFASARINVGTHSATNQYNTMANQGKLVPFSQRERGDLIFWGDGDGQYHVAIYLGDGQIIEAPDVGRSVHVGRIWGMSEVENYVGRPAP